MSRIETIRISDSGLCSIDIAATVERLDADLDRLEHRLSDAEELAAHPERTEGFIEERRRMWNQIVLAGVIAGLGFGLALSIAVVLAGA